ncbi:hypothetical protein ACQPZK_10040 [Micromonospora sp. CA-249363]|uniref:hypothetical protein n=1 Tax=Micromonospora sp. CA-249363 TaxID=3239963 RepID=UPI003D904A12
MHAVHIPRSSTRRLVAAGFAASLGVALLAAPASAAPASAAPTGAAASSATTARDAAQATATATRTGQRVEVVSARDELTQVFAKPGGGFVAETAAVPQRIRQADGAWSEVDLSLRRTATGWRPAVSPATVLFSAGGRGPAATLTNGARPMTLGWPGELPAPRVSGDAATYPEVLPGVDLVLTATHTGFTHVLVVKTPQAAANPALREIRFDLGGDAQVRREADGSLRALAGGAEVARAATAEMWDSSGSAGAPRAAASSPSGPGVAARTAPVATAVDAAGDLVLRPSAGLLDPAKATFPVYIDPAWSALPSRWAYATNNNSTNSDTSAARVGLNSDNGVVYRSYFEFPIGNLSGKIIRSASVQVGVTHTWSCFDTPTYLYQSGVITSIPRTAWAPALTTLRASANSHANGGSGCVDSPQPPMTVRFTGSVAAGLSSAAAAHLSTITYGLCACSDSSGTGESTANRWKKFDPTTARLLVDYDTPPTQPTALQVGGVACVPGDRVTLATPPTLSAVFPDADSGQVLQTEYELLEVPASGVYDSSTPRMTPPTGSTVTAGGRSTTAAVTGTANGKSYAFRTRSDDGYVTSPWSAWCEFTIDNQPPTVSVDAVTTPAPPGQLYTYKLRSPDLDVVSFRYGWSSPPTEEAEAGTSLGWTGKTVSVTLSTPAYGTNTLYVAAVDSVGNVGYSSLVIEVPAP